jgi:hypothetical protein
MSSQAYEADNQPAQGIEALASGAVANLWRSLDRIWPLWLGVSAFDVLHGIAASFRSGPHGLEDLVGGSSSALVITVPAALSSGVALRILLGRERDVWRLDRGLAVYAGITVFLATATETLLLSARTPSALGLLAQGAAFGLVMVSLRFTLWPIGLLLGDRGMTPGRAWTLMVGAARRYYFAVLLLMAPLFTLQVLLVFLAAPRSHLLSQIVTTPVRVAVGLVTAAVAAEVYKARVGETLDAAPV